MPRIGLVLDPVFERHDTGPGHPERPLRAASIRARLLDSGLAARCVRVEPEEAADRLLAAVHDPEHVARVDAACASGETILDSMDTAICPESARVARLAAGSLVALCRETVAGRLDGGLAVVRPPGHHAERDLAMGFCLFNNVAVAARWLRDHGGVRRVAVVDWDVHHGNGTQHLFEEDPDVFYFSCHQMPLYPGTGAATETGRGGGEGATLNCPLRPGDGDAEFLATLAGPLTESMDRFRPEFILVSAGFDPHARDPLGGLRVTTEGFAEATRIVRSSAERHCGGRLVSTLEGGYDIAALADSVAVHLDVLLSS
jgi:acetoin utilization deacetylase AcuC-like enzyme